jgi:hypothetical protein
VSEGRLAAIPRGIISMCAAPVLKGPCRCLLSRALPAVDVGWSYPGAPCWWRRMPGSSAPIGNKGRRTLPLPFDLPAVCAQLPCIWKDAMHAATPEGVRAPVPPLCWPQVPPTAVAACKAHMSSGWARLRLLVRAVRLPRCRWVVSDKWIRCSCWLLPSQCGEQVEQSTSGGEWSTLPSQGGPAVTPAATTTRHNPRVHQRCRCNAAG